MADAFIAVKNEDRDAVYPLLLRYDHAMREHRTHSKTHTVFYTDARCVQGLSDPRVQVVTDRQALAQFTENNGV